MPRMKAIFRAAFPLAFVLCYSVVSQSDDIPLIRNNSQSQKASENVPPSMSNPANAAEVSYNEGIRSLAAGDLIKAEQLLKKSLELDPGMVNAMLALSELAKQRGDLNAAGSYLQNALSRGGKIAEVQRAYGRYLYIKRDFQGAEAALRKSTELDPKSYRAFVDLGDLYRQALYRPNDAVTAYRKALSIEPKHAGAHYALALALDRLGKDAEAEKEFRQALSVQPDNVQVWQALTEHYVQRRQYDSAIEACNSALKANPNMPAFRMQLGDIYAARGDDAKSLAEYQAALKQDPKLAAVQVKIGMLHQSRNRIAEAEKAYLAAVSIDPKQAVAYNNLAWMAAERKSQLDKAAQWAKKAIDINPAVPQFHVTLGWVYRARGELDKAVTEIENASLITPAAAETYYYLGLVYAEKGMNAKAVSAFQKALSINKSFSFAADAQQRIDKLTKSGRKP